MLINYQKLFLKIKMSFRKEIKYRLTLSDQKMLKNDLFRKGMKLLFAKRKINSLYFDTDNLDFFKNSEEGVLPRKKVRIRWYDNNLKKLSKETKISSIEGRFKLSEAYEINQFLSKNNINLLDRTYGLLKPKILISYIREYYELNNIRLTFDSCIKYQNFKSISRSFKNETESVMEVKTNFNTDDDYIKKIIKYPSSRFSKYARGILLIESLA